MLLGQAVLAFHLLVIAFNVGGLVAIPLGAVRSWAWVRVRWWRALHLASWGLVAAQAALGRACILTVLQDRLTGTTGEPPLIMRWVNDLIFWPLPIWMFGALYLVLFAVAAALWWGVPPSRR